MLNKIGHFQVRHHSYHNERYTADAPRTNYPLDYYIALLLVAMKG